MCFYERFIQLCEQRGISPTKASLDSGCVKGAASYWKKQYLAGKNPLPETRTLQALAQMFGVSVDYLLCLTDDPIDYDDGEVIAEIPLSYIEAANGDVKKARDFMLAVHRDAQMESHLRSGSTEETKTPAPDDRDGLVDALYQLRDEERALLQVARGMTAEDVAAVTDFIKRLKGNNAD